MQFLYDLLGLQPGRTHLQLLEQRGHDLRALRDAGESEMDEQIREADAAITAELARGPRARTRAQVIVAVACGIVAIAVVIAWTTGLVRVLSVMACLAGLGVSGWAWRRRSSHSSR